MEKRSIPSARNLAELGERLRKRARKLTRPREAILELLSRERHPVSIRELSKALRERCDPATIYRSMHLLERMGMVKRYQFADGVGRFELLKEGDDGHHHHLVCTRCAGVVEIPECPMDKAERKIASRNGFKSVTHRLEFFGVCPDCQE